MVGGVVRVLDQRERLGALLEQLASMTGGRYYFMPTIDDLFEIHNYISATLTGNSLVADIDGVGRQMFAMEPHTRDGLKLNGMLFLRQ